MKEHIPYSYFTAIPIETPEGESAPTHSKTFKLPTQHFIPTKMVWAVQKCIFKTPFFSLPDSLPIPSIFRPMTSNNSYHQSSPISFQGSEVLGGEEKVIVIPSVSLWEVSSWVRVGEWKVQTVAQYEAVVRLLGAYLVGSSKANRNSNPNRTLGERKWEWIDCCFPTLTYLSHSTLE